MSIRSGFYRSLNGDRRYYAEEMSALFNGIINDGVFANIGKTFEVKATTGDTITIDTGRAWFNGFWIDNDGILPITADLSEVILDRIDAVVIEINHEDTVRNGSIKMVKGTAASEPQRPILINSEKVHQYPLAYIYRKEGSSAITQADITNMIGTSSCPYITGILEVTNIDKIVAQWEAQWNQWYAEEVKNAESDVSEWMTQMKADLETWLADLQISLEGDDAANLSNQIIKLQNRLEVLAKEHAVYEDLEDNNGDELEDSYGNTIEGKTVFATLDDVSNASPNTSPNASLDISFIESTGTLVFS